MEQIIDNHQLVSSNCNLFGPSSQSPIEIIAKIYKGDDLTLNELFQAWMVSSIINKRKTRTVNRYMTNYRNYIKDSIGKMPISTISRKEIVAFMQELRSKKSRRNEYLSEETIKCCLTNIHACFEYAIYNELVDLNPVSLIEYKKQERKETISLTEYEEEKFLSLLKKRNNKEDIGYIIMLYAGLRIGEVLALRWSDISFEDKTLIVSRSLNLAQNIETLKWEHIEEKPKSNSSIRTIPLSDMLINFLKAVREDQDENEHVVSKENGELIQPRLYRQRFNKMMADLGIKDMTLHGLRHTFATRALELGVDINTLSELLGHSSVQVTLDIYVHSSISRKMRLVSNIPFVSQRYKVNHDI